MPPPSSAPPKRYRSRVCISRLLMARCLQLADSTDGAHGRPQEVPVEPVISLDVGKLVLANDPGSMKKNLGALTMIAVCFNICNSWAGLATSVQIALLQGGPAALIYGLFVSTSIYICIALTIGELASVYPTAGGQMHFTSILAPKSINRAVSYIDSVLTVFSWIAIGAAVTMIPSQQIIALAQFYHPSLEVHPWLYFVIYQAFGALVATYNILFLKRAPSFHTIGRKSPRLSFSTWLTVGSGSHCDPIPDDHDHRPGPLDPQSEQHLCLGHVHQLHRVARRRLFLHQSIDHVLLLWRARRVAPPR